MKDALELMNKASAIVSSKISPDNNVEAVREKLLQRSVFGLEKYGVTTERKDIDLVGWLNHLQQELMDAAVYAQAMIEMQQKPPVNANKEHFCTYPKCNCPFDAPSDPNWCARGYKHKESACKS